MEDSAKQRKKNYMKTYYEKNKPKRIEYQQRYNKINQEKIKEYQRKYFSEKKQDFGKTQCPICFKFLTERYLKVHIKKYHNLPE